MNSLKRICLMWLCALAVQVAAWATIGELGRKGLCFGRSKIRH